MRLSDGEVLHWPLKLHVITQGLRHIIPAHDVYEDCQYYHAYTKAEIEAQKAEQAESSKPTLQEQVAAMIAESVTLWCNFMCAA